MGDLPEVLQSLITHHTPSMDHIAVLLALRVAPDRQHLPADVARDTRLERGLVDQILRELREGRLAEGSDDGFRYAPSADMKVAVDELAHMYQTKPVTLVRAIYDRPKRAAQSFADAFRLRKGTE